ncbi:hypothetical protein M9H77_21016 [Catharanthus roseus]|uniref:Uncharacterized protein n=1 Tax=Catharanthus roseus TaxID=4058 RepID=A0ACC0AL55_CATRO|nr:hypothetical protein M9H77_21016 [Catharanthus roseus]
MMRRKLLKDYNTRAASRQMAFLFIHTYENPIPTKVTVWYDHVSGSVRGLHRTRLVLRTRASSDDVDVSNSGEWFHLKRGVVQQRCGLIGLCGHRIMLCDRVGCLVECQEGLETKVGPMADLCLAGINYEMPKPDSDDLVLGSKLCSWNPTVVLHVFLNLGIKATLMCLDSLRLSSCARNPHTRAGCKNDHKMFLESRVSLFSAEGYADTLLSHS